MKTQSLQHRHERAPSAVRHGHGQILSETSADIVFMDGKRTVAPESAGLEPTELSDAIIC